MLDPMNIISENPNSLRNKFTKSFLRALKTIQYGRSLNSSSSPKDVFQRYNRIKTAADKSLARAVGSRRWYWSRASLCKIRNQAIARRHKRRACTKKSKRSSHEDITGLNEDESGGVIKLRELVPGGEAMEICRLLEEAANYVKSLNTQVQVMRSIADFYVSN